LGDSETVGQDAKALQMFMKKNNANQNFITLRLFHPVNNKIFHA